LPRVRPGSGRACAGSDRDCHHSQVAPDSHSDRQGATASNCALFVAAPASRTTGMNHGEHARGIGVSESNCATLPAAAARRKSPADNPGGGRATTGDLCVPRFAEHREGAARDFDSCSLAATPVVSHLYHFVRPNAVLPLPWPRLEPIRQLVGVAELSRRDPGTAGSSWRNQRHGA